MWEITKETKKPKHGMVKLSPEIIGGMKAKADIY